MSQEEDDFWAGKILDARHGQLDTVRKAAESWSKLFTAVLGVFGTVTFVSGLTGLNELSDTTRGFVRGGIVIAAVATLVATILAGSAANSVPRITDDLTIGTFQTENKKRASRALCRLRWSMGLGVLAAVVVLFGSFLVLFANKSSEPRKPSSVIAVVNGKTYCGTLVVSPDGTLSIDHTSLNGATSLIAVETCPRKA